MTRSIQARVLALAGAAVLVSAGALSLLARSSLQSLERSVERQQAHLAETLAEGVAHAIDDELRLLTTLTGVSGEDAEQAALASILRFGRLPSSVFLAGSAGEVLACEPADLCAGRSPADLRRLAISAIDLDRPVISDLRPLTGGEHVVVVMPFRAGPERRVRAAGVAIARDDKRFQELLGAGDGASVALVDGDGQPIALSPGGDSRTLQAGVSAAVRGTPWRLRFSEDAGGPAGAVLAFRRRALWLTPVLAGVAMLLSWGIVRSIRQPLGNLTLAAERIARGELDRPIDPAGTKAGGPEISRLAVALEGMRASLATSMATIETNHHELERRVAMRTEQLAAVNAALAEREQARRELLRKVISAQEDERKRIARELHDETAQTLAALGMGLEAALADARPEEATRRLLEARQLLTRVTNGVRRLVVGLRPSVLDDLGLEAAIQSAAEQYLASAGIGVRCEFENFEIRLPAEIETAVFRAVQEAIVNIARHAAAESVLIQGSIAGTSMTIEIEDDGVGFDPRSVVMAPGSLRGIGLLGMRERIEIVGGSVSVESEPGRGTRVVMEIPVVHGEEARACQAVAS